MFRLNFLLVLICLAPPVYGKSQDVEEFEARLGHFYEFLDSDPALRQQWDISWEEYNDEDLVIPPFECEVLPEYVPATNVHELKPSDVSVVAALGDSITAGNGCGAETLPGVAIENRGSSWSIGGNRTIESELTIPNLIKEYNPDVTGFSWSREVRNHRNDSHCGNRMYCSQLNVAEPGGTNRAMLRQAEVLIEKLRDNNQTEGEIDFENDWKVITMFIGGNDLCRICENWDSYGPEAYLEGVQNALDLLHDEVPRAFVQVVLFFDITPLENVSTGIVCDGLQWGFCACARREDSKPLLKGYQMEYSNLLEDLVNSGRYDTRDDFTVVIQPHQRDLGPVLDENGDVDNSYFAPDCFHLSKKGHHGSAYMLWNVMLMPVGQKPYEYDAYEESIFRCPSQEHPYFFTNLNSDVDWTPVKTLGLGRISNAPKPQTRSLSSRVEWQRNVREFESWLEADPERMALWIQQWEEYRVADGIEIPPLTCDTNEPENRPLPQSVHELTPFDIQVVAALGDSITSGNGVGADTLPGVAIENRGESWCIGGNQTIETYLTIPNILKEFNPDLIGFSYSRDPGVGEDRNKTHCGLIMDCSQLNVADPGGTNRDMPEQAEILVAKVLEDPAYNVEEDWKMVFLLIGGNDLCAACRRWDDYNPENYLRNIRTALDTMKAGLPRTIVHVVAMFDVTPLSNYSTGPICNTMHRQFCDCAVYNDTVQSMMRPIQLAYWEELNELININGTYDGNNDFTVVLQHHQRDIRFPITEDGEWDSSFLSPDCFHPSRKGHQTMAYQLWNMLLTPVHEKPFTYPDEDSKEFYCPTQERPFIFTNDNSRRLKSQTRMLSSREEWQRNVREFESWLEADSDRMALWIQEWEEYRVADGIEIPPLTCDTIEPENRPLPQSVHELTPFDIQVVAALGDSITSGNGVGADTLPGVAIENRGESWCIGGNQTIETYLTIPNILKEFNPDLIGFSYSRDPGVGEDRNKTHCGLIMDCSQLNVADPGGTNRDMPEQAEILVAKVLEDPAYNLEEDWKMVFLLIGGNDLCAACRRWDDYNPENYLRNIRTALDTMKAGLPRTIVHVVAMFDVTPLSNYSTGPICNTMHRQFCDCAVYNDTVQSMMRPIQLAYWEELNELININGTYDGNSNFTVVLQHHHRDMRYPITEDGEWDSSFLSPDCFHPSRKGHQTMAYQLWNMLLTPVHEKPFTYPEEDSKEFYCPTQERPFIFTNDNSRRLKSMSNNHIPEEQDILPIPEFECEVLDYPPATSVHALRPNDIRVVASFGDSITAGNGVGADTAPGVGVENRGESWSIGGNLTLESVLTIPNLIKNFSPDVTGWSWSRDTRLERNETYCSENMECSQLNVAEPGATNRGMANQARDIIDKMKDENWTVGEVDFENDWKLITLFIGGNDLCRVCENWDSYSPESYRDGIRDALDTLHTEVPRALVNLVVMFDITPLTNISDRPLCSAVQFGFCACAVREESREELRGIQIEYARLIEELVASGRYDTRDDFTVVLQPHMRDLDIPRDENGWLDGSYFSEDCFHPSRKGHHALALMLWNTMFVPVGQKTYAYDYSGERRFDCPSETSPYIYTNLNSNQKTASHVGWDVIQETVRSFKTSLISGQAVETDSNESVNNGNPSGLIIAFVGTIGLILIGLGLLMLVPYYKKTNKVTAHNSQTKVENPAFAMVVE